MSIAPPAPSTPHRFNRERYYLMVESGVLRPEDRVELLNGEVVDMSPIGRRHAGMVRRLLAHFAPLSDGRAVVGVQDPVALDEWNVPQPDVWLAKFRSDFYTETSHPATADLLLEVEVADTSLLKDRRIKIPLYAAAGVREVWLVDLTAESLQVFRDPAAGEYRDIREWKRGETTASLAFPELRLTVDELFPK